MGRRAMIRDNCPCFPGQEVIHTLLKVLSFMKCRKKGHASHWLAWGRAGTMTPNFKLSNLGTSLMPEESWVHRRCQGGLREHRECWRAPNTDKTW